MILFLKLTDQLDINLPLSMDHINDLLLINDPQNPILLRPWDTFEIRSELLELLTLAGTRPSSSEM